MPKSSVSRCKLYVAVVAACASTLLFLAAALATPEPPDYPTDKCVFLRPVPYDAPADVHSDALMQDVIDTNPDSEMRLRLGSWTMSVYWVNGSNYTLEDVYLTEGWCPSGHWLRDVPFPTDQPLRVTSDDDGNFAIVDPLSGTEWNLWAALFNSSTRELVRNANGYYEARCAGVVFTDTSGSQPVGCSNRGCGIAHSIGLIRPGELAAGQVDHALAFAIIGPAGWPCPPATHSDGVNFGDVEYPQRLPESALVHLKPGIWTDEAIETAKYPDGTPWNFTEKVLAKAARDFGIYLTDNTGCMGIYANNFEAYPEDPYLNIPGCEMDNRNPDGTYTRIWGPDFFGPDNFEVVDQIWFPWKTPFDESDKPSRKDFDGDGIYNAVEIAWGYRDSTFYDEILDPANGPADWDNDGLTNAEECRLARYHRYMPLNPTDPDSDGDGYTDLEEAYNWSADPTNHWVVPDPSWPGAPTTENLALNKVVSGDFANGSLAVDGDEGTAAKLSDGLTGSIIVDLGASCTVERVICKFLGGDREPGFFYGAEYTVQISPDGDQWTTIGIQERGEGGVDDIYNLGATGRYVQVNITGLGSPWSTLLQEIEVYGSAPSLPPAADFRADVTEANPPMTVQFTDLSAWGPTSWDWDFGDSGFSSTQHPSHEYTNAGDYTVSVAAANAHGQDTETKPGYISVTDSNCHVAAIDIVGYYNSKGNPGSRGYYAEATMTVHDQNGALLSGATVAVDWYDGIGGKGSGTTDGDGQVTIASPMNRWGGNFQCCVSNVSLPGYPYRPDLNVEDCDSLYVGKPFMDFTASPTSGGSPLTVQFTDLSVGATSWDWDFGDGTGSAAQNPTHQYVSVGDYTVSLTVSNSAGADSGDREDYIVVSGGPQPPVANFSGNPTNGEAPLMVYFTDQSSGSPTSWDWSFGDSGTSGAQNPSHEYTSGGDYTVSLEVCNSAGCDTETKPGYISVSEPQPPVADFEGSPTAGNAPLDVDFTDLSTNDPTSWSWTFGDGGTSPAQNPSHEYTAVDTYTVSLEACNGAGCDTETKPAYISVSQGQPPVAEFSGDPTIGAAPLTVDFTDLSTNSPTSWSWTFGDSGTSAAQNPSHDYTSTGQFTVSLTAANAYGQDTETKTDYITVTVAPPVADFSGDPTSGPAPLTVDFTDLSTNSPTSWDWSFGDTGSSQAQNPSHEYTGTGQFTVSLTAANAGGDDTETKENYITVTGGGGGDYVPYDYTVVEGSYVSGGIAQVQASDDSYLVVSSARVTGQQSTQIEYYIDTDLSAVSTMSVTQEWRHEGVTNDQRQRTYLYNFTSSGWDEVDNRMVNCTTDTTVTFDVSNPAPYLSSTGEVHVRFWCGDAGKTAWTHYVDLIKITAAE